jgi:uncharacterized protein YmfQ (DUF2313 family)
VPAVSALSEKGREMIDQLPSWLRDDPDARAVVHCYAMEAERQQDALRAIRADLVPKTAASRGLGWWERILGLTVAPEGQSDLERRDQVLAVLLQLSAGASGAMWEQAILDLIGPGVTYVEEDPYTIQITVSFAPDSLDYRRLERIVRTFTPAHLAIVFTGDEGFILDDSQLDVDQFHTS